MCCWVLCRPPCALMYQANHSVAALPHPSSLHACMHIWGFLSGMLFSGML